MPIPRVANIAIISNGPLVRANPTAVPRNGAEHGVANNVANAPVQKLFLKDKLSVW